MGPIKSQADTVMTLFRSPRTAIHLVTVLEEMPVQETADGIAELRAGRPARGRRSSSTWSGPRDLAPPTLAAALDGRLDPAAVDGRPEGRRASTSTTALVDGLLAEAHDHAGRRRARGLPAGAGRPSSTSRRTSCRGCRAASTSARSTSSRRCSASRGWHEPAPTTRARVGPLRPPASPAPPLDVDALLDDPATGIIVCCGSGGVGKTTTSAALALRAAERGRKVVVLTIDPARRLAQSMGIEQLDNTPRPVHRRRRAGGGSLDAMMLDMKRTFDEVVESQATPEKAQQILENPFYIALSSSFAGTQEYMAMEKLGQIHADAQRDGSYDLIVVDTPPSRSALDFLDAPERLSSFLDGRFIRLLLAPAKGPAKLMTAGFGLVTGALTKVLGAQVLRDLQTFVAAFDTLFGGFRQRAQKTYELLQADGTAFLVVAAPGAGRAARGGVLRGAAQRGPDAAGGAGRQPGQPAAGRRRCRPTRRWRPRRGCADERAGVGRGRAAAPARRPDPAGRAGGGAARPVRRRAPQVPTAVVPALAGDVHDLDGLRQVGDARWPTADAGAHRRPEHGAERSEG